MSEQNALGKQPRSIPVNEPVNLRLYTMEELAMGTLAHDEEANLADLDCRAHAIAFTYWRREMNEKASKPEEKKAAELEMEKHSDRHQYFVQLQTAHQKVCNAIGIEFKWRQDNPGFDPEEPFKDE